MCIPDFLLLDGLAIRNLRADIGAQVLFSSHATTFFVWSATAHTYARIARSITPRQTMYSTTSSLPASAAFCSEMKTSSYSSANRRGWVQCTRGRPLVEVVSVGYASRTAIIRPVRCWICLSEIVCFRPWTGLSHSGNVRYSNNQSIWNTNA